MKAGSFGSKREWKRTREGEDGSEKRGLCWGGETRWPQPHTGGDAHLTSKSLVLVLVVDKKPTRWLSLWNM